MRLTICFLHLGYTLPTHAHTLQELFYLLADAESSSEHEGGVVTTSSLAVELQAGGLTPVRMGARVPECPILLLSDLRCHCYPYRNMLSMSWDG